MPDTPHKEAANPSSIENVKDTLCEAIKHSILFEHDLDLDINVLEMDDNLNIESKITLLDYVDLDLSKPQGDVCAQHDKLSQSTSALDTDKNNMETEEEIHQALRDFLAYGTDYQTQVGEDKNIETQISKSAYREHEAPVKVQPEEALLMEEDNRFPQDMENIAAENEEVSPSTSRKQSCTGKNENNSCLFLELDNELQEDIEILEGEVEKENLLMTTEKKDSMEAEENNSSSSDDINSGTESDKSRKVSYKKSEEEDNYIEKKRKRRRKNEQSNKRQANIDLRLRGQEYKGMDFKESGNYKEQKIRPARKMKNRCNHKSTTPKRPKTKINSKNDSSRTYLCANIDEDLRQTKFQEFWSLKSWDGKRAYICGLVDTRKPYKRRSNMGQSRKGNSFDCYLHDKQGIKIRVCRTFFLNTLALGRDTFNRWLKEGLASTIGDDTREAEPNSKKNQKNKQMRQSVIEWLEIIPKVPSHYCRSSSSRVYVESTFQSKRHMHSIYEEWCKTNDKKHVACRVTFSNIMEDKKISIHRPRKDQCDTCYEYKIGNLSQENFENHRKKKDEGREAKAKEKNEVSDKKLVITMDLQSVLLCPKLLVSKIYYSQKLQLHDFTIYCLNNADVFLYVWHEGEGAVTSNEFVSCVSDFIKKMCDKYEEIVLISDGCNYQNRNRVLSSELLNLAVNNNIIIRQLILEKGHTMMEADSVHSTLENLFIPPIYSPGDYVSRMRAARSKHPYTVFQVDHTFFKDYENNSNNFTSIRPGRKVGDPTVTDIRALQYLPTGKVQYKLRHVDDWADLPQRRPNKPTATLKPLYKAARKLKKDKFSALQELKSVIPTEYHPFYDSLPHE